MAFVKVCNTSDIEEGKGGVFNTGDKEIAVFKWKGDFLAIGNACPHQGGPLGEGELYEEDEKGIHESQLALKTVWTNLVEGGTQNPGSVLGLSAVGGPGYVTLADHFFNTDVKSSEDVASKVKAIDTNQKVKSLVATKLKQFAVWRDTTKKELRQRKREPETSFLSPGFRTFT